MIRTSQGRQMKYIIYQHSPHDLENLVIFDDFQSHFEMAHALGLPLKLKIISAGNLVQNKDIRGPDNLEVMHGSITLGIKYDGERLAQDEYLIKQRFN